MFLNRTGLNRRVSGKAASSPGQAGGWSHQPASRLAGRGVPGAASKLACRAASADHHESDAFGKRGSQTQAPPPNRRPSVTIQPRLPRCWGVRHQAPTQFAFAGSTLVPMSCGHASPLPAIRLTSSSSGARLANDRIGDPVCFQRPTSRQCYSSPTSLLPEYYAESSGESRHCAPV